MRIWESPLFFGNGLPLEFAESQLQVIRVFPIKLTVDAVPALPDVDKIPIPCLEKRAPVPCVNPDGLEPLFQLRRTVSQNAHKTSLSFCDRDKITAR
jgi:hypothetical protein